MPRVNLSNLELKTIATIVFLFASFLGLAIIGTIMDRDAIVIAACDNGAWACSPSGANVGTIDGGGMYQCVGGSYQQQTSCSVGAKCCASGDQVRCISMSAVCDAPAVGNQSAEPAVCDIKSVDIKTCCKCDTGSMCLGAGNTFRKCVNGCFQELSCGSSKICAQITQSCVTQQTKCAKPGSVESSKKSDGANYLNICGTDYTANEIQCGLTLKQKEAAACYQAQTNGLSAAAASIKSDDSFTITSQRMQTGVDDNFKPIYSGTKFIINDATGTTDCQNLGQPLQSREATANEIRMKLGCAPSQSDQTSSSLCQSLELACCLTSDHCQSYGCDQDIVYDPYYGCTKVDFGKQLIVKKSDGTDCGVCTPGSFGCGEGLTKKDSAGIYAYKKCQPNTDTTAGAPKGCWGPSLNCAKDNADGCDQFCVNASEIKTWGKDALANIKTKTIFFDIKKCPKTFCSSGGSILVLDTSFTATACNYKTSADKNQSDCSKCRKDATTNEAVCETASKSAGNNQCGDGAKLCGKVCYNKNNFQDCVNGSVVVCSDTQSFGGISDSSKKYFPANICKTDLSGTMKMVPVISGDGKTGYCAYFNSGTCANQTICSNGRCVQPLATLDTTKLNQKLTPQEAASEIYKQIYGSSPSTDIETMSERLAKINQAIKPFIKDGLFNLAAFAKANQNLADIQKITAQDSNEIPGYFDPNAMNPLTGKPGAMVKVADSWKTGTLTDRTTDKELSEATTMPLYDGTATGDTPVSIVCDSKGCSDLDEALQLMNSSSIKDREWHQAKDENGKKIYGQGSGTYVCTNFAQDTEEMLRAKGIEAYTVMLGGKNRNGEDITHAAIAIPVALVDYNGNAVPTFAVIDPKADDKGNVNVIGQIGGGVSSITNAYNNDNSLKMKYVTIENAEVVDKYALVLGVMVATDKSTIYTFTAEPTAIGKDDIIYAKSGEINEAVDMGMIKIVKDTSELERCSTIKDLMDKGYSQDEAEKMVGACPK